MLRLRNGAAPPRRINLPGGAHVMVRPASTFENDLAVSSAGRQLAALAQGRDAAALAVDALGEEFVGADFTAPAWLDAAARRLVLLELASLCVSAWGGIADEDGAPIEKPTRGTLALLLRSSATAAMIETAIRAEVNVESAEKNASAASPSGEAEAGASIAQPASTAAPGAA